MIEYWLRKLAKLRVDRASKNPAPHKPLLLLTILDLIEERELTSPVVRLTPDLAFRFLGYWEIVASRGRAVGRVELPFFYLRSDGFLRHVAHHGMEPALRSVRPKSVNLLNQIIDYSELPSDFFSLMLEKDHRDAARRVLLHGDWFFPEEKRQLSALLGFEAFPDQVDTLNSMNIASEAKKGRDIRFRLQIIPLYHYACILCGIKMLLPSGATLVEAAHIHPFADSRNDDVTNGMALCRNHHWSFDQGLWTIGGNQEVIVACDCFMEDAPEPCGLVCYHSKPVDFSRINPLYRPNKEYLEWHRKHKYIG